MIIGGKELSVKATNSGDRLEVELPNGVRLSLSGISSDNTAISIGTDGIVRLKKEDSVRIVASDFKPKSQFGVVMFSEPLPLGSGLTSNEGRIELVVKFPTDVDAGRHTVQVNGLDNDNKVLSISMPMEILGDGSSAIGRVGLLTLLLALGIAILLPSTLRKRKRA